MNDLARDSAAKPRPVYSATHGFVDEIVSLADPRKYFWAFVGAAYQNPRFAAPVHQMILPPNGLDCRPANAHYDAPELPGIGQEPAAEASKALFVAVVK